MSGRRRRPARLLAASLGLSAASFLTPTSSQATSLYWDTNGTTAGSGAATGTWGVDSFWNTDPTGGSGGAFQSSTANTDDLFISAGTNGTTGTITVSGTQSANSITFQNNVAITLSGGTSITLGGGGGSNSGISVASGDNAANTISTAVILGASSNAFGISNAGTGLLTIGAITGAATSGTQTITVGSSSSGGITLSGSIGNGAGGGNVALTVKSTGSGIITLSGANTYTGTLTILSGTAAVSGANANTALGGASGNNAISLNGGTLQVGLQNTSTATTNGHVITVGASNGTIKLLPPTTANVTPTFNLGVAGNLTGSGNLTVVGTGSLGTAGTFNSVLVMGNANTAYSGNVVAQDGGILEISNAGAINGGTFTLNSQGEIALNTVTLARGIALNNGGVLGFNAGSANYSGTVTVSGTGKIRTQHWYNTGTETGTISGKITGTGAIAIDAGTVSGGVAILSNSTSDYSGGTTVSGTTLRIGASSTPTSGTVTSGPVGTGSITLDGGILDNSGAFTVANNIVVGTGTNEIRLGGANNLTLTGTLSGSGTLTLGNNGSNSSVFLNCANTMTGGTITFANNTNAVLCEH